MSSAPLSPQTSPPEDRHDRPESHSYSALLRDFGEFLCTERRWWAVPLVLIVSLLILLAWLSRTPERPPTYPWP